MADILNVYKRFGMKAMGTLGIIGFVCSSAAAGSLDREFSRDLASRLRSQSILNEPTQGDLSPAQPGWFVERADNTSLRISVLSQARYMVSQRDPGFIPSGTEQTFGFSMPRTRIALDGAIVSSQFNYRISFDFGDAELSRGRGRARAPFLAGDSGAPRMLDAYAQYNFSGKREGYYFKFGQFQNPLLTEEAIASEYQLAVDRSVTAELFGPGYTQGIALGRVDDTIAWEVSITDGGRYSGSRETDNTAFNSVDEADFAFGFRGDWKLAGAWDQFADFTSFQGSNPGAKLGAGFLYQFHGHTNPGVQLPGFIGANAESAQAFTWTIDYQYEADGWNFFAAYVGQWVDWEFSNTTLGMLNNAVMVQGGYFLTDQIEVFGRFETFWIDKLFRNGFGTPDGYIHRFATVGVTQYILPESHAAKITADASYAFDSLFAIAVGADDTISFPDPATTGFLGLTNHEFVLRVQLQLLF